MRVKSLLGSKVLDKNAYEVGDIADVEFDNKSGAIKSIVVNLKKGILSNDELEIEFGDVATIGAYVILNKEIPKEEDVEQVEVEIEDDEE